MLAREWQSREMVNIASSLSISDCLLLDMTYIQQNIEWKEGRVKAFDRKITLKNIEKRGKYKDRKKMRDK